MSLLTDTTSPLIPKKKRKPRRVTVTTVACKYDVVRDCCSQLGFRQVSEEDQWLLYWIDTGVSMERVLNMKPYQTINHFPGMHEICKKHNLARNLSRLGKLFPKEYNFWPKTWSMPVDYAEFVTDSRARKKKNSIFIAKPESGCQGKGIFLFQNPQAVKGENNLIVQEYIRKPLLIDGFKFDLRVYVLVTSCDPLKVYVYEDGLARFATVKYVEASVSNMSDVCMHLTNYAINKKSENFVRQTNSNTGSKRNLKDLFSLMSSRGYKTKSIWPNIQDIIMKTLLTVIPSLRRIHQTCFPQSKDPSSNPSSRCFEILGFDVMLDRKMKPWVIEVNHSPSFTCDSPLDTEVKTGVIKEALQLLNLNPNEPKRWMKEEKEKIRLRLLGEMKKGSENRNGKLETERRNHGKDKEDEFGTQLPFLDSSFDVSKTLDKNAKRPKNECDVSSDNSAREEIGGVGREAEDALTCNTGGYQQIYPCKDAKRMAKYEMILSAGSLIFSETVTTKSRREYLQKKLEGSRNSDPIKKRPPLLNSIPSSSSPALSSPRRLSVRDRSEKPNPRGNSAPSDRNSSDGSKPGSLSPIERNSTASSSSTPTLCSLSTFTLSLFQSDDSSSLDRSSSSTLVNHPVKQNVSSPVANYRAPHEPAVGFLHPSLPGSDRGRYQKLRKSRRASVNLAKSRHDEATRRHSFLRMLRNSTPHHNQGIPSNFQFGGKNHSYLSSPHASKSTYRREPSEESFIKESVKAGMKSSLIYTSFSGSSINWEPDCTSLT